MRLGSLDFCKYVKIKLSTHHKIWFWFFFFVVVVEGITMLLITSSSSLIKHKLSFAKLSDCMEHLPVAAIWAERKWGYIRNKDIAYCEGVMNYLKDSVYIATFAQKPVAMFALLNHEFDEDLMRSPGAINLPYVLELRYVHVEKDYHGLGFGKQIIDEVKILADKIGAEQIQLGILTSGYNRML
jgi:GNAT superfamily N-acetyltransferase